MAWELKGEGYPQPTIKNGQYWVNRLGYVSEIYVIHIDWGIRARKLDNKMDRSGYMSEEFIKRFCAYMPTVDELNQSMNQNFVTADIAAINWVVMKKGTLFAIPATGIPESEYLTICEFAFRFNDFLFFTTFSAAAQLGGAEKVRVIPQ